MNDKILDNFDSEVKKAAKSRDMYKIIFTTEDGKDMEYEIVATFKSKANKKIYYIMTDNTRSKDNELNITPFYIDYDEDDEEPSDIDEGFYPVTDDDELKMVFDVFNDIKSNL